MLINLDQEEIQQLKELFQACKPFIEKGDWETVYEETTPYDTITYDLLSAFLFDSGINPLYGMSYIPGYFISRYSDIKELTIPKNVNHILDDAFAASNSLKKIIFEDKKCYLSDRVFNKRKQIHIEYPGTIKEFKNYMFYPFEDAFGKYFIIHCTDGNIAIKDLKP